MIVTFELEEAQGELEIVHANTVFPKPKPVMLVVGESEFVIVPLPETSVHTPVPTTGVLAAMNVFALVIHSV